MTATLIPPPAFDLPPGRLEQRKRHLVAEISATPRTRVPRRLVVGMASVAMLGVLVAAPAFGLHREVFDFLSSEPASERVQLEFARLDVTAPPEWRPGIIAGEARKVTEMMVRGKRRILSVAPTQNGGYCFQWTGFFGGCHDPDRPARPRPRGPHGDLNTHFFSWGGHVTEEAMTLLGGHVRAKSVERLEVEFADGERDEVPLTWVSEPIDAGFYLYDVPERHRRKETRVDALVGRDADGDVVARATFFPYGPQWEFDPKTGAPDVAILDRRRKLIEITTERGRTVVLWEAPSREGGTCHWLTVDGRPGPAGICPPRDAPEPRGREPVIGAGLFTGGGQVLFEGSVRDDVAVLELRFQDGTVERVRPVEGWVLHEIGSAHYPRGHRLVRIVARDASGRELDAKRFEPNTHSLYPCDEPVELGAGLRGCP
jgi:hypothetical protein